MSNVIVKVSDFTRIPGPRFRKSGQNSAQEFFEDYVRPKLQSLGARTLVIDFSGTWGYPSSFTSQLGIYIKEFLGGYKAVKKKIEIASNDNQEPVERFWNQLKEKSS